jgi:acyl-CoA thioester hydrolase
MAFFVVRKKIHWSDGDAAGIAWFPNFLGWFEDAEEELFAAALGRPRQALLDEGGFGMPRVEAHIRYEAPVKIGTLLRIGIDSTIENPRRLRHAFEMTREADGVRVAHGYVRVACVELESFAPRDLPDAVRQFVERIQTLAVAQTAGHAEVPWT